VYGDPQNKLCESAGVPVTASGSNQRIPLSGCPVLAPNSRYWVAFNTTDDGLSWGSVLPSACGGAPGDSRWAAAPCGTSCTNAQPTPWGAAAGPCPFRMYLTLQPVASGTTTTTSTSTSTSTTSTSTTVTTSTSSTAPLTTTTLPATLTCGNTGAVLG